VPKMRVAARTPHRLACAECVQRCARCEYGHSEWGSREPSGLTKVPAIREIASTSEWGAGMLPYARLADPLACLLPTSPPGGNDGAWVNESQQFMEGDANLRLAGALLLWSRKQMTVPGRMVELTLDARVSYNCSGFLGKVRNASPD